MRSNDLRVALLMAIVLSIICNSTINGQSANESYQTESIFLKRNKYVKNGNEFPIDYWSQHLKNEMSVNQDTVLEYSAFERKRKTAFFLTTFSIAVIVSASIVDNSDLQYGLVLGGLGLSIASVSFSASAYENLHKAIWLHNCAILE